MVAGGPEMATSRMDSIIRYLRKAVLLRDEIDVTDGELLEQFVAERDETAFHVLVKRHGSMVLGVCRRLLRHEQDAEDAFQAVFLVLAQKASSISPPERVGNWLHGVAQTTVVRMNAANAKRRALQKSAKRLAEPEAPSTYSGENLQRLDQEL